jgi:hypothetical protein
MLIKKIKALQIFSDGSLNYYNNNFLKTSKKLNFWENDFKNSKFCEKKIYLLKNVSDHENVEYRYKFF